jgi:hypothetical protein
MGPALWRIDPRIHAPRREAGEASEMIDVSEPPIVASTLDYAPPSLESGGGMARAWCRATERRRGMATLLAVVTSALPGSREPKYLRNRFEAELREMLNAREVELRDGPPTPRPPESSISIGVTTGDLTLGAIDALFDEGQNAFDPWDLQMIEFARQLAALVMMIDRAQRAGTLGPTGVYQRLDHATTIVGSSAAIREVRARMQRVAATPFTVLIEGESGC